MNAVRARLVELEEGIRAEARSTQRRAGIIHALHNYCKSQSHLGAKCDLGHIDEVEVVVSLMSQMRVDGVRHAEVHGKRPSRFDPLKRDRYLQLLQLYLELGTRRRGRP